MFERRKIKRLLEQRGVDALIDIAGDTERKATIRTAALSELAALADPRVLTEGERRSLRAVARSSVLDEGSSIRMWALALMSLVGDEAAGHAAVRAAADPEPLVRTGAIIVLAKSEAPGRMEVLTRLLHDREWPVRQMAACALMDIGDVAALPYLRERREHEEEGPVRTAILAAIEDLERRSAR